MCSETILRPVAKCRLLIGTSQDTLLPRVDSSPQCLLADRLYAQQEGKELMGVLLERGKHYHFFWCWTDVELA